MKMQLVSEHWLHFQYVPKNKEVSLLKNIYFPEEDIVEDDLFYICFMLEKVARFVKKPTSYIVKQIGEKNLYHLLSCAQALHCDNPEKVAREWVNDYAIQEGNQGFVYIRSDKCRLFRFVQRQDLFFVFQKNK